MPSSARSALNTDVKHICVLTNQAVSADTPTTEIDTLGYAELHYIVSIGTLGGGTANILVQSSDVSGSGYATLTGGTVAAVASKDFFISVNLHNPLALRYHIINYDVTGVTAGLISVHAILQGGAALGPAARPFSAGTNVTVVAEI